MKVLFSKYISSVGSTITSLSIENIPSIMKLPSTDHFSSSAALFILASTAKPYTETGESERESQREMAKETTESLEKTPTWAVATVCFVLISLSILIEHLLHLLAQYLNKKKKKSLIKALEKIKSDLMLLGFMSLLLTVSERPIPNICIPTSVAETFLPCRSTGSDYFGEEELKCQRQGKASLLSSEGVKQLQYLIFVLAIFHFFSCVLTFGLGMARMRSWASWEAETRTFEYQFTNDPRRFQLFHQTSFGKRHLKFWSENRLLRWPVYFLRQFYKPISKTDYLTLRHGFIMAHFSGSNFDFQKYIRRALEKDFGVVTGMSSWIWMFSVLFIFFNAYKFHNYMWLPFIPLVLLLLVGTKLQAIITQMCLDSHKKSHVVIGSLLVSPSDHYFWFDSPKLTLHMIHFILVQNSFQLAFFTWTWYKFGLRSCFHRETQDIIIKLVLGVLTHVLCGYVTLPLYALVTQMGSSMKEAVFPEKVAQGLKIWRRRARKKLKTSHFSRPSVDASLDASLSLDTSPSFTFDSSYSLDRDLQFDDTEHVAVEIEEEKAGEEPVEYHETDSFDGFHVANASPMIEGQK